MTMWIFLFDFFKQFDTEASFKAYFSVESPPEFTVTPTDGMLEAYGSEGTNFVVSFTPKGEHSFMDASIQLHAHPDHILYAACLV